MTPAVNTKPPAQIACDVIPALAGARGVEIAVFIMRLPSHERNGNHSSTTMSLNQLFWSHPSVADALSRQSFSLLDQAQHRRRGTGPSRRCPLRPAARLIACLAMIQPR